jgi:hypothetical protein
MKNRQASYTGSVIWPHWAAILAVLIAFFAFYLALAFANQPLLEMYGFRQTQTAITSWWLIRNGWSLAYETPVAGYPWAIPMEFPFYQRIVSIIAWTFHLPLDPIGRILSFCFLLACAWPIFSITGKLKLNPRVAWVSCALLWSSPIYLFWGRTFTIETCALFFTLASIPFAIDLIQNKLTWKTSAGFAFFATLGLLQKVTTAAPVLLILAVIVAITLFKSSGVKFPPILSLIILAFSFLTPLIIVFMWTAFTDSVKSQNPLFLTFGKLTQMYFGTFEQRIDVNLLKTFFWDRIITKNAGGFLGLAILGFGLYHAKKKIRSLILISLLMFALPILIFFNAHLVHYYYQVSSIVFLTIALAIALVEVLPERIGKIPFSPALTLILVGLNFYGFFPEYAVAIRGTFNPSKTNILAVADVIRRYTPTESAIVVFGADWSSETCYYSERKSFTVPAWYEKFDSVWKAPSKFIGDKMPGALVFYTNTNENQLNKILSRPDVKSDSCLFKILDTYVWLPGVKTVYLPMSNRHLKPMEFYEKMPDPIPGGQVETKLSGCDGVIEQVNEISPIRDYIEATDFLSVSGWMAVSAMQGIAPDQIFLTLKDTAGKTNYFTTISQLREDVIQAFKKPEMGNVGFRSTIDVSGLSGNYVLGLAMEYQGQLTSCEQFNIHINIKSSSAQ